MVSEAFPPAVLAYHQGKFDEDLARRFRTGLIGVQNDPKVIKVDGLARSINKTMPMPRASIMEKIIEILNSK